MPAPKNDCLYNEDMPILSIIIPTHKRAAILRQCLWHLERQTVREQLEIIVVSDGHDPETAALFQRMENGKWRTENAWKFPVRFFEVEKSQQGVARNRGVQEARGEYVMFIGDDIFLAADTCEQHVRSHRSFEHMMENSFDLQLPTSLTELRWASIAHSSQLTAVLGSVTWDPQVKITPVMRWLERSGWQFGYPMIERFAHQFVPQQIQHRFTYTSHLSLPTHLARSHPFQRTDLYGWEDIEWGKRIADMNVRLFYEPAAKAWHHHHLTLENSLKRMETLGRSAALMAERDLPFDRIPRGLKLIAYHSLALLPTMRGRHARAFLRGMRIGAKTLA